MKVRIGIIASLGLLWLLANLPASLLRNIINSDHVSLIAPQGTVWHGSARLVTALDIDARIRWQVTLWRPGLDLSISDENSQLGGRIEFGTAVQSLTLTGELNARSLAPLLRRYDLFLPGVFTLNDMTFLWRSGVVQMEKPSFIAWSGGDLRYILANRQYEAFMPPLQATLDTNAQGELETRVSANEQDNGLLMVLSWKKNGNVYFGVSRGMLRLVNYPWSGSESEETLIFEVERRLTHSASPSRAQHWHFARKRSQSSIERQANAAVLLSN